MWIQLKRLHSSELQATMSLPAQGAIVRSLMAENQIRVNQQSGNKIGTPMHYASKYIFSFMRVPYGIR